MDFDVNKLNCIFTYFEEYIDESIYQVLNDSPTDPDYSAVTAISPTMLISKIMIPVMNYISTVFLPRFNTRFR